MIKKTIINIKQIDKKILKTMLNGFKFSLSVSLISCIVLLFYILNPISNLIYECGITLFRISIIYICTFFICAYVTNKIKNEIN